VVAAIVGADSPDDRTFTGLTHGQWNQATGGVWRVTGPRGTAVLKRSVPGESAGAGRPDPAHWNYWHREALAYRDGLPATAYAASGIVGPRLLACVDEPGGGCALWLEDVVGEPGSRWPVSRLAEFGHALGTAQAPWTDRLPARPWLSREWLRQYVVGQPLAASIPWDHPLAVGLWPAALRAGMRRMWEQRDLLLSAAESGPRTLCHLDVWPLNLIAGGEPALPDGARAPSGTRTVLLDWAFAGEGGVGEDIADLIPDCVADGLMSAGLLPEIAESVTSAYLRGLRDAGLRADEDALRRTVAAAGAAKYCWLAPLMLTRLAAGGPVGSQTYDAGGDNEAVMRRRIGLFEHLVAWSEQVLD
jgi:hypothetical protein